MAVVTGVKTAITVLTRVMTVMAIVTGVMTVIAVVTREMSSMAGITGVIEDLLTRIQGARK